MAIQYPELYDDGFDYKIPNAVDPGKNQQLKNAMDQLGERARQFKYGMQGESDRMFNDYARQARQDLSKNIADTRASYNRRGLLHSGMRMGSELAAQANYQSALPAARYKMNQGLLGQLGDMENQYLQSGINFAGMQPNLGGQYINSAQRDVNNQIANLQAQQSIYNGLGQAGGGIVGGLLGLLGRGGKNKAPGQEAFLGNIDPYFATLG